MIFIDFMLKKGSWKEEGGFLFSLGTTSCIYYPADIILNVSILSPIFDDIELVLFEEGMESNIPNKEDINILQGLQSTWGITYTIHLPLNIKLGHPEDGERQKSIRLIEKIFHSTRDLNPEAYILHAELRDEYPKGALSIIPKTPDSNWIRNIENSLKDIILLGISPETLCLENLEYPLTYIEGLLNEFGFGLCLDMGHLLLYGYDVDKCFNHYFNHIKVIHLHGIEGMIDHRPIKNPVPRDIERLLLLLKEFNYKGILTLELFDPGELEISMETLLEFFSKNDFKKEGKFK